MPNRHGSPTATASESIKTPLSGDGSFSSLKRADIRKKPYRIYLRGDGERGTPKEDMGIGPRRELNDKIYRAMKPTFDRDRFPGERFLQF